MKHQVDIAIIGGGIAGLWTANVLKARGYSVALFSKGPLGSRQTLASQGVIHGGAKYALAGKLTDSSEELAAMPGKWRDALNGVGDVDLSGTQVLSEQQVLWSLPSVTSQVASFFGSKLMRGRSDALPREQWPAILQSDAYRGRVFQIDEPVLDPISLVECLHRGVADSCYQGEAELIGTQQQVEKVVVDGKVEVTAKAYLLTAGAGNGALLDQVGIDAVSMQLRPLHQVIVRAREASDELPDFYSVCIGNGAKPPMVTTTHTDSQERKVWWIGGDIAEAKGVARSEAEQIDAGRELLQQLLPWQDWDRYDIFTAREDRAEPLTGTGDRPPGAFCEKIGNVLVGWPTKLALAPNLADKVLGLVEAPTGEVAGDFPLPRPGVGEAPWDLG